MDNSFFCSKGFGSAKYIVVRNGLSFLPIIAFYRGIRLFIEKNFILLSSKILNSPAVCNDQINYALQIIDEILFQSNCVNWNGLFLDTSWYKKTVLVGCAGIGTQMFFFKYFKTIESAHDEVVRMEILSKLYGHCFAIPKVERLYGSLIVFSYLPRIAWPARKEGKELIENAMLATSQDFKRQKASFEKLVSSFSYKIDMFKKAGLSRGQTAGFLRKIRDGLLSNINVYPVQLAHGDMTPWNMYRTKNNQMALVDSERAGLRVIYTDFLHYLAQPHAMSCACIRSSEYYIRELQRAFSLSLNTAIITVCIYLAEEIAYDLLEIEHNRSSKILHRALIRRYSWLTSILDSVNNLGECIDKGYNDEYR